ncbi:MAG: hypothetical protein II919_06270 [Lachnospiraceae bacterium]|nr:hypothetical protein [Lachnospiraceae bacterium]
MILNSRMTFILFNGTMERQAVKAAKDAHAKWFIPVHWGAFVLANHAWNATPKIAVKTAAQLGVNIATPKIRERVDYDHISEFDEHWWEWR